MGTACVVKPAGESYDIGLLGQLGPFRRATYVDLPSRHLCHLIHDNIVSISLRGITRVAVHVSSVQGLDVVTGGVTPCNQALMRLVLTLSYDVGSFDAD